MGLELRLGAANVAGGLNEFCPNPALDLPRSANVVHILTWVKKSFRKQNYKNSALLIPFNDSVRFDLICPSPA